MKVHELMTELSKIDPNEEIYLDFRNGAIPVTHVKKVPLKKKSRVGGYRFYPHGDGVKRCKSTGIVLTNKEWS